VNTLMHLDLFASWLTHVVFFMRLVRFYRNLSLY